MRGLNLNEAAARFLRTRMMELILVVLCVVLSVVAPNFFTSENLLNILRSISMQGVIAFGMTMVIVCGEIDLSVGSMVAFAGCLLAWLTQQGVPLPLGFVLTLLSGLALGAMTGWMRTSYQVPTFITTLALYTGLKGAALMITEGFPLTPFPEGFAFLGGGYVMGVPFPTIILVVAFALAHFTMKYTTFGRAVYAVGGNAEAARLCGIAVGPVRIAVLSITAMFAALSGMLLAARIMSGTPTVAQGWELDVITAVIIGGTSLMGGVGTIWGTLVGVVFIGVIVNGMTLMNINPYVQYVVRGALILVAVLINRMQPKE